MVQDISHQFAAHLLRVGAVRVQLENPFQWASGWLSPFYCDNRKTLAYPEVRTFVKLQLCQLAMQHFSDFDVVAGVATGAIAQGALVAEELHKPYCYVRSKAKDHGMKNLIEGEVRPGSRVLVVEDLISTGMSSLKAVAALRDAGCEVVGMIAAYTYGFDVARDAFAQSDVILHTISDYKAMVEVALSEGKIKADDVKALNEWRSDPANWKK